MGCLVLRKRQLYLIEGKIANMDYEFACDYYYSQKQVQCWYLAISLDNNFNEDGDMIDNETKDVKYSRAVIAGLIYDNSELIAEKAVQFLKQSIRDNIYFQIGNYEDGFANILQALSDYIYSTQSQKFFVSQQEIFSNFLMKIDDNIYLSKSFPSNQFSQNSWKISQISSKNYRDIDLNDLDDVNAQFYKVKKQLMPQQIKEIILTSNSCKVDVTQNLRQIYPINSFSGSQYSATYYFKLKNIC